MNPNYQVEQSNIYISFIISLSKQH